MKKYKLYVDETGGEHPSHPSKYYILIGCIVEHEKQHALQTRADLIKYRYWKHTNIVLHSKEIAMNQGDFGIFDKKPELKSEFIDDILHFLNTAPIRITCCVVDKDSVYKINVPWKRSTVISKTTDHVLSDFLCFVYSARPAKGVIVFEASGFEKDSEYLKSFNKILTPAWQAKHPEFPNTREHLTSVSFATKLNHDVECQIADLLSYAALCRYKSIHKIESYAKESYEQRIIEILNKKLIQANSTAHGKRKALSIIKGFCELPLKSNINKTSQKKRTA